MPLAEEQTKEFCIYDVSHKQAKDARSNRKAQKKPIQDRDFINAILKENEVVFVLDDGDVFLGTLKDVNEDELGDAPLTYVEAGIFQYVQFYYIRMLEVPFRTPRTIPISKIKKIIVKSDNITEISNSLTATIIE